MDLLCIGNAMVDVFAEFAPESSPETAPGAAPSAFQDFRKQFGLNAPVQHISPESAAAIVEALAPAVCGLAQPSEKAAVIETPPSENAPVVVIKSGGNAANTAKMAARLGLTAAFAGAVGGATAIDGASNTDGVTAVDGTRIADSASAVDGTIALDRFGAIFEAELKLSGIATYLARKQSPTGLFISITQRAGDIRKVEHDAQTEQAAQQEMYSRRVIAASPSAALELDQHDIDESLFAQTRILLLENFLLGNQSLTGFFLAMAEKYKLTIALDAGTADAAAEHAALIHSWFGCVSLILFLNEKEAEAFTEALGFGPRWENFFTKACQHNSDKSLLVAVKLAERGAAVFSDGAVYHVETKPVDAAETTGAGDAFAAGFLAAWLRGEDPRQCGMAGNAAGVAVVIRKNLSAE